MRTIAAALTALCLFGATACGGSDGSSSGAASPEEQAATDALVAMLSEDPEMPLSDDEARCAAGAFIRELGAEAIVEAIQSGDEPDFASDDEMLFLNAVLDCVDLNRMMMESMMADGASEEEASCIVEAFGEDEMRDLVSMSMLDEDAMDEEAAMALFGTMLMAASTCGFTG